MDDRKRPLLSGNSQHPNKKAKLVSRKKKAGFDDEIFSETSYYIRNGLRYVKPYYFTFTTHAKGRWVGFTVYDIFCREFQAESPEYYARAIEAKKVKVNGKCADKSTVISHNDLICHTVHRHEPPITAQPLTILHMDSNLVVINKPSSIPIHPCGRYRHNSVVFLLGKEHNLRNLHTVHRLDRLTSGLLILARTIERAQQLEVEIRERRVSKEYVCRVQGEFTDSRVECDQPILVFSHKLGLSRVDPQGKPCSTAFTRLSFNGETSVVKCEPKTGRMHQIRVHLQWLGHPIVNDPLYNHPAWKQSDGGTGEGGGGGGGGGEGDTVGGGGVVGGGVDRGEAVRSKVPHLEKIVQHIVKSKFVVDTGSFPLAADNELHKSCVDQSCAPPLTNLQPCAPPTSDLQPCAPPTSDLQPCAPPTSDLQPCAPPPSLPHPPGITYDPECTECHVERPTPSQEDLVMYLHAVSYKGEGWSFATPLPPWADSDWEKT